MPLRHALTRTLPQPKRVMQPFGSRDAFDVGTAPVSLLCYEPPVPGPGFG